MDFNAFKNTKVVHAFVIVAVALLVGCGSADDDVDINAGSSNNDENNVVNSDSVNSDTANNGTNNGVVVNNSVTDEDNNSSEGNNNVENNNVPDVNNGSVNNQSDNSTTEPDDDIEVIEGCPPFRVNNSTACTAAQENVECPGTFVSETCSAHIKTSCTCLANEEGFGFVCDFEVDSCEMLDAEDQESRWRATGACVVNNTSTNEPMFCYETMATDIALTEAEDYCEGFSEVAGFSGQWQSNCENTDGIGSCYYLNDENRYWNFGGNADPVDERNFCESEGNIWVMALD